MEGTSPKLSVKDGKGRTWSVKFGAKEVSECLSSRFVAALGYIVEPSYYVAFGKLEGAERLRRDRSMVNRDGTFGRARFQLRDETMLKFVKDDAWSLAGNPFRGTHELAGLRAHRGFRIQLRRPSGIAVQLFRLGLDAGAVGRVHATDAQRLLGVCGRYATLRDRGARERRGIWLLGKHEHDVKNGITVDDIRWLAPLLQGISDEEIRAGLKASGATQRQTACWAEALEDRMHQLQTIARPAVRPPR